MGRVWGTAERASPYPFSRWVPPGQMPPCHVPFSSLFAATVYRGWTFLPSALQCWSESGLVSPAVSPSPQGQSPSPSPSPLGQSPSPSGVSPSPLDQSPSPSPSPLDQSPSPSPSPLDQSPSPSPWVQQRSEWVPDLSPDSAWTHESNNRKVLYFNPTFNHFCWALYW